jgi:hypothetical protein
MARTRDREETTMSTTTLRHFTVTADPETGEWITEPKETGVVLRAEWAANRDDTDSEHFDTFEYDSETCAVTVIWNRAEAARADADDTE